MLTERIVIEGYFALHGKDIPPEDLHAFMRLAEKYDALHYNTYANAHHAIMLSLRAVLYKILEEEEYGF